jgi:ribosome-binding protein aMBF1 (putative translation factor)
MDVEMKKSERSAQRLEAEARRLRGLIAEEVSRRLSRDNKRAGKPPSGYGSFIKAARIRSELSQEQLAERCDVTKGVISQWENEIGAPKRANARKLATVLRIDLLELEARLSGGAADEQQ